MTCQILQYYVLWHTSLKTARQKTLQLTCQIQALISITQKSFFWKDKYENLQSLKILHSVREIRHSKLNLSPGIQPGIGYDGRAHGNYCVQLDTSDQLGPIFTPRLPSYLQFSLRVILVGVYISVILCTHLMVRIWRHLVYPRSDHGCRYRYAT